MYNSITVTVLARIWEALKISYSYSFLKYILINIGKGFKFIGKDAAIVKLFSSDRKLVDESLFYSIYLKFMNCLRKGFLGLNSLVSKHRKGSFIDKAVGRLFKDDVETQNTTCVFMFFFGMSILIINIFVREKFFGKSNIVSAIIILFSILGMNFKNNYKMILNGSCVFRFVRGIFLPDPNEGGTKWW